MRSRTLLMWMALVIMLSASFSWSVSAQSLGGGLVGCRTRPGQETGANTTALSLLL
ncbi:MAG: hypothetical protein R3E39_27540 [Anaerolineae bacterium]